MQLTPSQVKALSTQRHLAITANAGSGKTRVLVKRYVDLFERDSRLAARNVAAITFTDSSAAELRSRIAEEVKERLVATSREDTERRHRLVGLRDSLSNAFIGTIHGFASRILRAYPVEANIDASFALLTGADQRIFVEEAISRVFYSSLDEAFQAKEETPLLHLFRALGRSDVTGLIRTLIANRSRSTNIQKVLLSEPDDKILTAWRIEFEQVLGFPNLSSTKTLLASIMECKKSGVKAREVEPYFEALISAKGFFETIHAFHGLASRLITKDRTIHSQRIDLKKLSPELASDIASFIAWYDAHESLLKACPASDEEFEIEHKEYIFLLRAAFNLYDQVLEEYLTNKTAYGLLDFDDLILGFKRLLEDSRIRAELAAQFLYVMIDEYQDTDENQFQLASLLTENFGNRNNLTIVGDPKQSIYTFRNADASIFHQTRQAITSQQLTALALEESIELNLLPEEERGEIALRESFRMTDAPLTIINRLFRSVMQAQPPSGFGTEEVEYSDLVQGRASNIAGTVEWICPAASNLPAPEEGDDETEDADEAGLIALKIQQIVNDTEDEYLVEVKGERRTAQYDDIAVLLRSRTNLPTLEQAFRLANIPYTIAKGAGFYSQQEILDISSYLNFLITPLNDIALATILRSPFFALSDVDLFQIAHHRSTLRQANESRSFWDQIQSYTKETKKPHLLRAVEQLRQNLTLAGRTNAALLVEKIYAETGVFATLAAEPNGMQKVMNLEKFLAQARESDASGFSSLFDFVDRIQYLIEEDENESQATVLSTSGAVQIMTVHGAKGLEFPIVIVPFLQKKFKLDHVRLLDKKLGLHIKYPDTDKKPLIAELIRLRAKHSTIAEEKRIFYVALTRARDHLILSSTMPVKPPQNSWLGWLIEALPAVSDPSISSISLEERIERYDGESQQISRENVRLDILLIRCNADIAIEECEAAAIEPVGIGPVHLMPLPVLHPKDRFSATQFLMLHECPTKYHLSYVLGMPEEPKLAYDMEADEYSETVRTTTSDESYVRTGREDSHVSGKLLGQIVHKLLDKIDSLSQDHALDEDGYARELDKIFFSLSIWGEEERAKYKTPARKHLLNFLESSFSREVLSSPSYRREYALQAQLQTGDILFGIIDCLYLDADGIWTILDYKTDGPKDAKRKLQQKSRYEFQLGFYAYLVHLLFPGAEKINAVLFYTDRGELDRYTFDTFSFANIERECERMIEEIRRNENIKDLELLDRNLSHCSECSFFDNIEDRCVVLATIGSGRNHNIPQKPTESPAR